MDCVLKGEAKHGRQSLETVRFVSLNSIVQTKMPVTTTFDVVIVINNERKNAAPARRQGVRSLGAAFRLGAASQSK